MSTACINPVEEAAKKIPEGDVKLTLNQSCSNVTASCKIGRAQAIITYHMDASKEIALERKLKPTRVPDIV